MCNLSFTLDLCRKRPPFLHSQAILPIVMQKPGIYTINIGEHFYFGQAQNLAKRSANHLSDLSRGKHNNKQLQRAYDKYGGYDFRVLLVCEVDELNRYEQRLLNLYQPLAKCANVAKCAEASQRGTKRSPEQRAAVVRAQTGRVHTEEARTKMAAKKHKPVGVLFTDGSYRRFGSVGELALELGINRNTVNNWVTGKSAPRTKYRVKDIDWV